MKAAIAAVAVAAVVATAALPASAAGAEPAPLPQRLSETGLFAPGTTTVRAEHIAFSPQYPLWSDGTGKRRWISLPPGTSIDASKPDAWEFPVGTKLWKEFSYGAAVETRYVERLADGSWRFAAYVWNEAGTDAELAPLRGAVVAVASAPGGQYKVPGRFDCLACHEGGATPVLGFSALQLSPDRDPLAPHADAKTAQFADLKSLAARGVIRNLPRALLETPPRIAAASPTARAALSRLHPSHRLAVATNAARAEADLVLRNLALAPLLHAVITRENYAAAKPAPDAYLAAARALGLDPTACVVVEDTERGLIAARAAGMRVIAMPNDLTQDNDFTGATRRLTHLDELTPELLASLS
jgi:HAD superfamily hydrolase (TIGR01509 family)